MTISTVASMFGPELILLLGACLALLAGGSREKGGGHGASPVALLTLLVALFVSLRSGKPAGDEFALGLWLTSMTYYVRVIGLGVGVLILLVNWSQGLAHERGEYMAMILLSLLGVLLTASANDWIVLFFAVELVSVPTYVLIALSREDARASESCVKYFFLGALAAAVLAYGFSFLYGAAGTTLIHSLTANGVTSNLTMGTTAKIGFLLAFGGLAFKVAAVPFHLYAPDVYEGAASPVTGLLGFVPKFAGLIAMVKLFAAFNWTLPVDLMWFVWIIAAVTMTVGNVLALLQKNVKRMLGYSSIAHTGYMLIGLLVGPGSLVGSDYLQDGVAAMFFYIAVYGVMNLGVFAVLAAYRNRDRDMETLDDLSGFASRAPAAALALAVCVFSLMGVPPTAGFLGKLYIFSSAFTLPVHHVFHGPMVVLAVIGVINAAIAAAYYLRIVSVAYTGAAMGELIRVRRSGAVCLSLACCSVLMLFVFLQPIHLAKEAKAAALVWHEISPHDPAQVTEVEKPMPARLVSAPSR